ncbi:MAG TPA: DNA topology modulation protein [Methanosarcinales archaeon]|nr:DNA topology modulation protein [Methanosarcinales archaeon]
MKKVIIIGSGGAGKSTLARKLSDITGIEIYHLDKLFWQPGWISITREELAGKIKEIVARDSWIIDGNYSSTMDMRMEAADTIIYLDFASIVCIWGILKRRIMYAGKKRPDITEGCNEKIDWEFFNWVLSFRRRNRKKLLAMLHKYAENRKVFILRSRREVDNLMNKLQKELS